MNWLTKNPKLRWAMVSLAVVASAWIVAQVMPPREAVPGRNPFRTGVAGRPLMIAHAGGLGLHPGNTLDAIQAELQR